MPLGAPVGFRPTSACTRPRSARAQRRLHALSVGVVAEALSRNRAAGDARAVGQQVQTVAKVEMMSDKSNEHLEALVFSFDLGFSDIYPNESVRSITFENKSEELEHIRRIKNADSIVNFVLFAKLGGEHPSAQMWLETETDLSASIYLMLGGYYRQALICLRTWLELALIGIYYSKYYKGETSRYNQWKSNQRRSPAWKNLLDSLFTRPEFKSVDKAIDLRCKLKTLYTELSAFVHNRGMAQYKLQDGRNNVPRYVEHAFDTYHRMLQETLNMLILVLFVAYTNELTYTKEEEWEAIENLLGDETKQYVESLYK